MSGYCGGIIEVFGFTTWLINQLQLNSPKADKGKKSDRIDWNGGNKNHIISGSKQNGDKHPHHKGWRRLGIDPEDEHAWELLLPIFQRVVDEAKKVIETTLSDGSTIIQFYQIFEDKGVEVMVKIWIDPNTGDARISDVIPYLIP